MKFYKIFIGLLLWCMLNILSIHAQVPHVSINGAYMVLSGGTAMQPVYLTVDNPNPNAIQRIAGHIHSENHYHYVKWFTYNQLGNYIIPFGVGANPADYIPLEFQKTSIVGNDEISFSTFFTNAANIPYAANSMSNGSPVNAVTSMPQANLSIDRFWNIETNTAITANIKFSYRGIENTTQTCWDDTLKAQNWNGSSWNSLQLPGTPGVNTGIGSVGPVTFNSFGQFALTLHPLEIKISDTTHVTCYGWNDGAATVSGAGGLGPYTYLWLPGGQTTATASNLYANTYTVTVTGANGCSQTASVTITQPDEIIVNITHNSPVCELHDELQFQTVFLPNHSYQWTGPNGYFNTSHADTLAPALVSHSGTYTVVVTNNQTQCTNSGSVNLVVNPNPVAVFAIDGSGQYFEDEPIQFVDLSIGNQSITNWNWDFQDGFTSTQQNPTHIFADTGYYAVQLSVQNNFGCKDTTVQRVQILPTYTFFIPNTFTPNRDLINPIFAPKGAGIKEFYMEIFNRWGQLIYKTNSLTTGWDGTDMNSNQQVQVGVYVYKIFVLDLKNQEYSYIGNVNLLR